MTKKVNKYRYLMWFNKLDGKSWFAGHLKFCLFPKNNKLGLGWQVCVPILRFAQSYKAKTVLFLWTSCVFFPSHGFCPREKIIQTNQFKNNSKYYPNYSNWPWICLLCQQQFLCHHGIRVTCSVTTDNYPH